MKTWLKTGLFVMVAFVAGIAFQRSFNDDGTVDGQDGNAIRRLEDRIQPAFPAEANESDAQQSGRNPTRMLTASGNSSSGDHRKSSSGKYRGDVQAEWTRVQELRASGRIKEAIPGYVWCYDNAQQAKDPAAIRNLVRRQLANFARTEETARAALLQLRDNLKAKVASDPNNKYLFTELALLHQSTYDRSNQTLDPVQRHLVRSGHPNLLYAGQNP